MKNASAMRIAAKTTTSVMTTNALVRKSGADAAAAVDSAAASAFGAEVATGGDPAGFRASVVSNADAGRSGSPTAFGDPVTSVRLVFLRFFLNLLPAPLDVLAHTRHRVARA